MHTYRKITDTKFVVGFDYPGRGWADLKEFEEEDDAAQYVCWLNGGNVPIEYIANYLHGYVATTDTATHLLLSAGGDPVYNIVALSSCQIANRSTNETALITLLDGDDVSRIIGFVSASSYDARDFKFSPPIIASPGNDIYCASVDAVTTLYVAAQGHKLAAS